MSTTLAWELVYGRQPFPREWAEYCETGLLPVAVIKAEDRLAHAIAARGLGYQAPPIEGPGMPAHGRFGTGETYAEEMERRREEWLAHERERVRTMRKDEVEEVKRVVDRELMRELHERRVASLGYGRLQRGQMAPRIRTPWAVEGVDVELEEVKEGLEPVGGWLGRKESGLRNRVMEREEEDDRRAREHWRRYRGVDV
ncbi:hypothetical protein HK101_010415 [Irineochytrium annulatum]|nr:hypothetical protein HK101_010415 [Irineochytrium annulatum]